MIGDREYYYIPISLHAAWKVTRNEESEAVNKEEIEYKVRQRLYRLNGKSRRNIQTENYLENLTKNLIKKEKIIPMIVANKVQDDFIQEERANIERGKTLASTLEDQISHPVLAENG